MTFTPRPPGDVPVPRSRSATVALLRRGSPWIRRALALACLLLAAVAALNAHPRAAAAPQAAVLIAAHSLSAGSYLTPADVKRGSWPPEDRTSNALTTPSQAVGQRLATGLVAGELITRTRLVGRDLTRGLTSGLSAATVSLAGHSSAALLHAGDHVDLLASDPAAVDNLTAGGRGAGSPGARVLGDDVAVLAVLPDTSGPDARAPTALDLSGDSTGDSVTGGATEIIVAVDRATALRLASVDGAGVLATLRDHQ
ncbi:Flp pilus assembly protein CpaB [Frankineae bacterium MT45]|nr:Flp pilus assembly protein CpaB [Frankineae bacterium MT45]